MCIRDRESVEAEGPAEAEGQEPTDLPDGAAPQVPGGEDHVDIGSGDEAPEPPCR